ncbi:MAG: hypothetical protein KME35_02550 [Aphanocapsa sp. GSE-SYN-MK-11-07L]|jgi:serine/threonine protein kinase|nr:hypothetical protein [Aphanocapsa sp. GSE-SYN-MK-11-07L]
MKQPKINQQPKTALKLTCLGSDRPLTLTKQIANSGEGTVWETSLPGFLAKLYHDPSSARRQKLEVMIANPPADPMLKNNHISFAWPQDLLQDGKGKFVGFLMPTIKNSVKLSSIYSPRLRKQKAPRFNWYYLHTAALNVASVIKSIHARGYVVGDIKPQNILINDRAAPSVIDTDSFQVTDPLTKQVYRCLVGSEGFTPIELLGKDLSTIEQTDVQDRFRLGVLIHLLLFGDHPFKGKWTGLGEAPSPTELIRRGFWPYAPNSLIQPGPSTIPLAVVHPGLQTCFRRCFNDGHTNPRARPSAEEWVQALKGAIATLKVCSQHQYHYYNRLYGQCYWCERKAALGLDIFDPTLRKPPAPTPPRPARPIAISSFSVSPSALTIPRPLSHRRSFRHRYKREIYAGTALLSASACLYFLIAPDWLDIFRNGQRGFTSQPTLAGSPPLVSARQALLAEPLIEVSTLALSPNGQTLATGGRDADVRLWHTRTGKLAHTLSGHTDQVIAIALSPDEQQVYSAARNGEILNWQVSTGKLLRRANPNRDRSGQISAVAISPDTRLIASNVSGQAIVLRNLRTGQDLRNLNGFSEAEQSLAISPDGRLLVSSAIAGATRLWNLQTGKVVRSFSGEQDFAVPTLTRALAISPNERVLATGGWDGEIILKDINTGEPLKVLHAHAGMVQVLLFSADGKALVSGGSDGLVKIWQLPTGRLVQTLAGAKTEILSLALSRNRQVLASASQDGQVYLWQLKAGQYSPSTP